MVFLPNIHYIWIHRNSTRSVIGKSPKCNYLTYDGFFFVKRLLVNPNCIKKQHFSLIDYGFFSITLMLNNKNTHRNNQFFALFYHAELRELESLEKGLYTGEEMDGAIVITVTVTGEEEGLVKHHHRHCLHSLLWRHIAIPSPHFFNRVGHPY